MNLSPLVFIAVAVFVAAFLAVWGIVLLLESRRSRRDWQTRVRGHSADARTEISTSGVQYIRDRALSALQRVGEANQSQQKAKELSALRQLMITAGYRKSTAPAIFTGIKLIFLMLIPGVTFLMPIPSLDEASLIHQLFAYLVLAASGLYIPELWLGRVVTRRKLRITNGFPDALDLLVVCVEAGLGLDAALARTGKELSMAHPELCEEFHLVALELRAGLPRAQALTNLGRRVDLDSVRSLVALLIQTDRFGTSIGLALRVHSDSMRVERSQKAEELAGKLPVKMLFPLMLFIFPSIFIAILGPAVIKGMRILLPTLNAGT